MTPEEGEQWKKRFLWLWKNATDGFEGPNNGWWLHSEEPTEDDLAQIDKVIEK